MHEFFILIFKNEICVLLAKSNIMQLTLALIAMEILLWRCSTQKIAMDSRFPASKNKKLKINNNRFLAYSA
jgi:hypothetical protein